MSAMVSNSVPDICQAWDELASRLKALLGSPDPEKGPDNHGAGSSPSLGDATEKTEQLLFERLTAIAGFINDMIEHDGGLYQLPNLQYLADASRDVPILRSLYGLRRRPSADENTAQAQATTSPDCVLELARRLLRPGTKTFTYEINREALRIIANCCADNNVNRALVIHRGGIEDMILLADKLIDPSFLLPTLYNVCADFDELTRGENGKPLRIGQRMDDPGKKDPSATLTVAEQRLGMFSDSLGKTSLEVLLPLVMELHPDNYSLMADVIETSSRPALFGTKYILGSVNGEVLEQRLENLFTAIYDRARQFLVDDEARISICQTYMNLLTQPEAQAFVSQSPKLFSHLIYLPYNTGEKDVRGDAFKIAFLKLAYTFSTFTCYPDMANGPGSTYIQDLATGKFRFDYATAPVLVLINNSLTTNERTKQFHHRYQVEADLVKILKTFTDYQVILPALSLCIRLALLVEGQVDLFAANIFSAINHLLTDNNTQRESILEIHRETLALTRLVIKSQPTHASDVLTQNNHLFLTIVTFATTSIDATSKVEAGRLIVEILRTTLSAPYQPLPSEAVANLSSPPAISAMIFLVTDGPSSAIKAEGLFGLGLLTKLPNAQQPDSPTSTSDTMFQTLSSHCESLLPALNDIACPEQGPSETPSKTTQKRKAEFDNLKFLLSQLLAQPSPTEGMESLTISESSDADDHGDFIGTQQAFRDELRILAKQLGLSIDTYPGSNNHR